MNSPSPVHFEAIENFRDFGGYAVAGGGRVRRGRLYRSGHHGRATPEDLKALARLELDVVVDLRRPDERAREPSRRPQPFAARVIDNDQEQTGEDAFHVFLQRSDLSVESMDQFLINYYRAAPFEPRHLRLYADCFRALADRPGPLLIHCAAGKDRTGILAALILHALGVSPEDALSDFLLTNDWDRINRRLPDVGDFVQGLSGRRPSDDALRTTMGVKAAYLATAFAAIAAECGGVDAYLEAKLGVAPEAKAAMRSALVEGL